MTQKYNKFSFISRLKSFKYAFNGIFNFFKNEPNARVQSLAAIVVIGLGIFLRLAWAEWCLIVFAIALVLVAEIINSAIEKLVDIVSLEYNPKAAKIKDYAAGGVLFAAIAASIIGMIVFIPKFIK